MNIFWTPILRPLLAAARARRVIEIGADSGRNSQRLARWCRANGAFADIIDPLPGFDAAEFDRKWEGAAKVHLAPSLDILDSLPAADVVLIDGDHNWFTVYYEINLLLGPVEAPRPNPPILVFHDTSWPWARRDAYYEVSRIPEDFQQPHGLGPISPRACGWAKDGIDMGLVCAATEGGPRNGVRTAIEDGFVDREAEFDIRSLGAFFGLTVAVPRARLEKAPEIGTVLQDLSPSPSLRSMIDLLELGRLEGTRAILSLYRAFGGEAGQAAAAPATAPAERPLQTAMPVEVWRGIQRGLGTQRYKGRQMFLHPLDLFNYMSLIETLRPATIFEIGSHEGGRALWMADQLRAFGIAGRVLSLDIVPTTGIDDPLVEIVAGNAQDLGKALSPDRLASLPRPWLVIEDADHSTQTSQAVLEFFDPHLHPGDRIVIEDGNIGTLLDQPEVSPPHAALQAFLSGRGADYRLETDYCDRYGHNMTANPNGWLVRL